MMEGLNSPVRLSRLLLLLIDTVCEVGEAVMLFVIGEFPVELYVGGWVFGLELEMELRYTTPGAFRVGWLAFQLDFEGNVAARGGVLVDGPLLKM
jgi:hypothetical protein